MDFVGLLRGVLGIAIMVLICYLFSINRSKINWKTVGVGLAMQLFLAIIIIKVPGVDRIFEYIANKFVDLLSYSTDGATFVFGDLGIDSGKAGFIFAFQILPVIVFFSAITAILYYYGILQKIVYGLAWLMAKTMGLSGPESLATAANIFIGQTEAPLTVKPYLASMSKSEIMCLMTGGMATIAGSVFAAFVLSLGKVEGIGSIQEAGFFAKHLLSASLISAPAAVVAAKILVPEVENKAIEKVKVVSEKADNVLDAIAKGTVDGVKLAVNVGAMLLVFTALVSLINAIMFNTIGEWTGLNEWVVESTSGRFRGFDLTYIMGVVFAPIAWLLGTPSDDIMVIGQLLGQKTVVNEFYAYEQLKGILEGGTVPLNKKSIVIATYALCGFANFASIGIQIGGISALAPNQRKNLTQLGMRALLGGTIASFLTAAIAGIIV